MNTFDNYEIVSDYYLDSNSNIEEFRSLGSRSRSSARSSSRTRSSSSSSRPSSSSSRPSFLQQKNPSSSKQYSQSINPSKINYKGGALTTNKLNISPSTNNIKQPKTSDISLKPNPRYQKKNTNAMKTGLIGAGLVGTGLAGTKLAGKYNKDKNLIKTSTSTDVSSTSSTGSTSDFSSKIKTSNDLKIDINKKKEDQSKLVLPSNIQSTYDDILAHTKNKIENQRWNNYDDKNYSNRYNRWKNKYYWNRGWKYRSGYWDNGYWNDGYWYYNPYLFYSYLGYPYPYPYTGYYYLEYPYLNYPITNIDQTQLDEIENKIDDIDENQNEEENNSEEFNKFLLDELIKLKIRLGELEKYKQEKETEIKDETNLEKNLISQVKSEIQNLDNLEDISEEIIKFLGMKIKEETNKLSVNTTNKNEKNLIENFNCRVSFGFPYFIVVILIILVFVLRK